MTQLEQIRESLAPHGLALRGGFQPGPEDAVPALTGGRACGTILLLGNLGGALWPVFAESPELADGAPHPLDRWTRRILESLAPSFGATDESSPSMRPLRLMTFSGPRREKNPFHIRNPATATSARTASTIQPRGRRRTPGSGG